MTRTGAVSIVCRRNSPKFEKPAEPASTAVVTPPSRLAFGSSPYGLPSYQWPWRSIRPGVTRSPVTSSTRPPAGGGPVPAGSSDTIRSPSIVRSNGPSMPWLGSMTRPPRRVVRSIGSSIRGRPAVRSSPRPSRPASYPATRCRMTIYSRFGVRTVVNARGNATLAGGTLMAPEVVDAMSEAAGSFALIADLQDAASEVIAEVTGAEAGYVTTGAAAALTLGAAAILARLDPDRMEGLPDTGGGPSQFVVQRSPPKRLRPPRPRVRRTARRVRRRERRDGRRDGGLHRPGDGRRVLPGPARGARPADRRVRGDWPTPTTCRSSSMPR